MEDSPTIHDVNLDARTQEFVHHLTNDHALSSTPAKDSDHLAARPDVLLENFVEPNPAVGIGEARDHEESALAGLNFANPRLLEHSDSTGGIAGGVHVRVE